MSAPSAPPLPPLAVLLPGDGAAFPSRVPRLLHPLLGRPLAYWAAAPCLALGVERIVVLAAPAEMEELAAGLPEVTVASGLAGEDLAAGCLLLRADAPLLTPEALTPLLSAGPGTVLAAGDGVATAAWLGPGALDGLAAVPTLEEALGPLADLQVVLRDETDLGLRVGDRLALAAAALALRQRILEAHMRAGVTVEDPLTTWVEPGVRIGVDTVLRSGTRLAGNTVVGAGCDLGPAVSVTDCVLGDGVRAQYAVLADSAIGDETRIGPFAHLRPGCRVGRKVKIGNFVELKASLIGDGASVGHLAYVGDAEVGEEANLGAGTITCNYDGRRKHRTVIGARVFVGSHTTLVAPVSVGEGAFTAAGTVVTEDVPADALAIGRSRQTVKPGWAKRKREQE